MRPVRWSALMVLVSCSRSAPTTPAAPEWPIAALPSVTIGATESEPGHELAKVSGARMQGHWIVVANSGAHELQRFDTAGRLLSFEGRKGRGPGEFEGIISLSPAQGDSLHVFDNQNLRWSLHDGAGRYARSLPGGAGALARPAWLHQRTLVRSPAGAAVAAWVLSLLDGLPEPILGSPAREAVSDDLGFLWIQDSASANSWKVHGSNGPAVGRVELPAGFSLLQAGKNFVLGVALDTADQEIVRLYHLGRPDGLAEPAMLPSGVVAAADSGIRSRILADFNGVLMAQELFYSTHGTYTANADSLGAEVSSGAELVLLSGDKRRWVGFLYDRATGTTCGLSVGFPAPNAWLDGAPFCGR